MKQGKSYDTKKLFLDGLLAFGRAFGMFPNPMSTSTEQIHYTPEQQRKRAKSHAKFKAQRIARRAQRKLLRARA